MSKQEKRLDRGREVSSALAQAFRGKVVRTEAHSFGVVSEVRARYQQMPVEFEVVVAGLVMLRTKVKTSLKHNVGLWVMGRGRKEAGIEAVLTAPEGLEAYNFAVPRGPKAFSVDDTQRVLNTPGFVEGVRALNLGRQERFTVLPYAMKLLSESADTNLLRKRLEIMTRMARVIARPATKRIEAGDPEYLLKLCASAKTGKSFGHQFGGRLCYPVQCPACDEPASLMIRLDAKDRVLAGNKLVQADFPVLWCLNCCDWGPIFFDLSKETVIPFGKVKSKSKTVEFSKSDLEAFSVALVPVRKRRETGSKSKFGGLPIWIQHEDIPECPKCKQGMTFVLQLASNSQICFGDMGMLYAFICPACKISATLVQSH